jgi:ribonucleoside-diphosphate reductase alpha chain
VSTFSSSFAENIYHQKYAMPGEHWPDTVDRVISNVLGAVNMADSTEAAELRQLMIDRKFLPGGRYLYAAGREMNQTQNCALYRAEDTREGWADLQRKVSMALMTGAGVGVDYSDVRASGSKISRTGGIASGPLSLMKIVNEIGRNVMQGGSRRSAIWAGLSWWHADIFHFIKAKNWSDEVKALKEKDFTFPADLDMTNISVILDKSFFEAMEGTLNWPFHGSDFAPDGRTWQEWAKDVYSQVVEQMVTTAEPGFSVNYDNPRESLRNACTEITSEDDSDICNLGSLNLAAFDNIDEFQHAVFLGTLFLMAGTVYSILPHEEVYETREKNRRLGLGLMGVHEWLLKRGKRYGPDEELGSWLNRYCFSTSYAAHWASELGLSVPAKTRAIAPNGTIGILAETTTSAEPIFAAAYKRRVRNADPNNDTIEFEYVVDPVAARLVAQGVDASLIEDAYSLSYDVERRIEFQAWLQRYVDHGISSTVNLPSVDAQPFTPAEFGEILYKYLPKLRGITAYPDGCRAGQPLTSVPLEFALDKTGVRYEENEEACIGGLCGV